MLAGGLLLRFRPGVRCGLETASPAPRRQDEMNDAPRPSFTPALWGIAVVLAIVIFTVWAGQ